jgi:branched-chain amino acid transport system permease protein
MSAIPAFVPSTASARPPAPARLRKGAAAGAAAGAGLLLPWLVTDAFYLGLAVRIVVLGIAAVGFGFLMRQCGMVMFGVAAFIGLPAYALAIAGSHFGATTSVLLALAVNAAAAATIGALFVRARPLPFAMLTLALSQLLKSLTTLQSVRPLTGGSDGLSLALQGSVFGIAPERLTEAGTFWPIAWLSLCAVVLVLWAIGRSRFGEVLRAIQANEERMRFSGFDTFWPRLGAFVAACTVIGMSGVLIALHTAFVSPDLLDFGTGGNVMVAALVGGCATRAGPLLGSALYTWGQDVFGATGHLELLTGAAVMAVVAFMPSGVMGGIRNAFERARSSLAGRRKERSDAAR